MMRRTFEPDLTLSKQQHLRQLIYGLLTAKSLIHLMPGNLRLTFTRVGCRCLRLPPGVARPAGGQGVAAPRAACPRRPKMNRRFFLLAAPAIVAAPSPMKVSTLYVPAPPRIESAGEWLARQIGMESSRRRHEGFYVAWHGWRHKLNDQPKKPQHPHEDERERRVDKEAFEPSPSENPHAQPLARIRRRVHLVAEELDEQRSIVIAQKRSE